MSSMYRYCTADVEAVRAEPDSGAERVTEALLWDEVQVTEESGEWLQVTIPNQAGYAGWIPVGATAEGVRPEWTDAVVVRPYAPVSPAGKEPGTCVGGLWMGSPLSVLSVEDKLTRIAGPDGKEYVVSTGFVQKLTTLEQQAPEERAAQAAANAMALLDVPYLWGGMSLRGVDCSGLIQVAYRAVGLTLPRDAGMQYDAGEEIDRATVRAGDTSYLATDGRITHVMMMTDNEGLVHAYGRPDQVQTGNFSDDGFPERCPGFRRFL